MKTVELIKNRIGNARCAVLGFGVSNIPLVELLIECGNEITVHDKNDFDKLDARAKDFATRGVKFVCGATYLDTIDADIIFRSPGIRPDYDGIVEAVKNGAKLTSEMELFLELTPAFVFAITGSDGKTTTTTITYKLLEKCYENTETQVYVGGNIGTPLLSKVGEMTDKDICVLELSSFQLMTSKKALDRAVITNLSPNHLDWHKGMDEYVEAKTNIYKNGTRFLVSNANNELCRELINNCDCDTYVFSAHISFEEMRDVCPNAKGYVCLYEGGIYFHNGKSAVKLLDTRMLRVPGKHNIENYMAALALTWCIVGEKTVKHVATTFSGVEHRLEFVRELNDVFYFNSSIDSSPSRTAAALGAFADLGARPIVICGGYDKNIPFEPLAKALKDTAKAVVLTGATANKINEVLEREGIQIDVHIEHDFERAVNLARKIATKHDIVLLSPACASFDSFKNFMERGDKFKKIVNDFR
jgi:UDP-N-acetylmuramoylalanine--D-glutamate ligase